ncbi:hypothetical protein B0T21DRAFT_279280 [Apiosordaria backusii]|uniref:DUF3752 domain-containing protein n=1 Tax=Apiosordaria backusii TaxID=314023 RepID=A0AA40EZI6_9PEZI|nr:hypothetical protein B0T21DRAFT_279280 [Apiosordaria backusii]
MSSIGPQLPPHLQKRKRTPEDDKLPGSPPPKVSRRDNEDEIPLDDDSDDGFGPSAPPLPKPSIGPPLPPASANTSNPPNPTVAKPSIGPSRPTVGPTRPPTNKDEIALDDSDSDSATGPALPPSTKQPPSPPRRVIGPAPPPAPLSERPTTNPDSDSDSDDDYGPALPGSVPSRPTTHGPSLPSSHQHPEPQAPKRDDWMIAPPTDSSYRAPDPTKLKARKFNTGPRAATESKSSSAGVSSIWTETPEEKRRRLANAVLGREDPSNAPQHQPIGPSAAGPSNRTAEDEAKIKAYTEQTRGKSLVEQHQARKAERKTQKGDKGGQDDEEEDDPSKRAFSWEKDMKVGGAVSGKQKRELLNKAANFGGRFQKGSYL